jgi:hypothetical protein
MRWVALLAGMGLGLSALPALAHHSTAAVYDRTKFTSVQGFVTRIEVQNPHSMIQIAIPLGDGQSAMWTVETRGVQVMNRLGLDGTSVRIGDKVTATGAPAWAFDHQIWLTTLRTSRGQVFEVEALD